LKQLISQRSLEQEGLQFLNVSLTRYEKLRKELELEIQDLRKKNLLLQQEVFNKDEKIVQLENLLKEIAFTKTQRKLDWC
jgi:4-hydroxyphenylpyruvate dioxygenase-like putative hemolysin